MKNKQFFVGLLFTLSAAVLTTGCFTAPPAPSSPRSPSSMEDLTFLNEGSFADAHIPVKDFVSLGMVFTRFELQRTELNTRNFSERERAMTLEGNVLTYQELLREAHKLGADAIINVAIDTITRSERIEDDVRSTRNIRNYIWYGSALAIKYTNAIVPSN